MRKTVTEINYDLKLFGELTPEDENCRKLIINTLLRLPKTIREKVLDEVFFFMVGGANGHYFALNITTPQVLHLILLNFREKDTEQKTMNIIAHEIAHYILGCSDPLKTTPSQERKADDLSEKWGFGRVYESYEQFEKMVKEEKTLGS